MAYIDSNLQWNHRPQTVSSPTISGAHPIPMNTRFKLPPPDNWQDFERLCWELWQLIWNDLEAQRNGREGQPQNGVDIFGRPGRGSSWHGIQCKKTSSDLSAAVIRQEVEKATRFTPAIGNFIIATTAERSAAVQQVARQVSEQNESKRSFSVSVLGWDDIVERLYTHPVVLEKWYGPSGLALDHISGLSPFTICVEVIPEMTGAIAAAAVDDFRHYALSRNCEAVLYSQEIGPNLKEPDVSSSECEIIQHITDMLAQPSGAMQRIVRWEAEGTQESTNDEVVLLASGPHLVLRITTTNKGVHLHDCTAVPVSEYFGANPVSQRQQFQPFPSIHQDIAKRLSRYMSGDMLGHSLIFGFEQIDFPDRYLSGERLLASALDKMSGNATSGCSELAFLKGRALLVHDNTVESLLPGFLSFLLLPLGRLSCAEEEMDALTLLFHSQIVHRARGSKARTAQQKSVMRQLLSALHSKPVANGGAFERLLEEEDPSEALCAEEDSIHDVQAPDARFCPVLLSESPTRDELCEAIVQELRISTGNDLSVIEIKERSHETCTQITFALSKAANEPFSDRKPSDRFFQLLTALGEALANGRPIHSIAQQPLELTDAMLFALKVNWKSHPEQDEINLFDLTP